MPSRKTAASPASRVSPPRRTQEASSAWADVWNAFRAVPGPVWRLISSGFSLTAVAAIASLVVSCSILFGRGGCDAGPLNPFGPATTIARRADQLATQYGFTAAERTTTAAVFRAVADEIRGGSHGSATTVDATTRSVLGKNFGPRWNAVGAKWLQELSQAWKGRFLPDSSATEMEPLWREVAAGLGG